MANEIKIGGTVHCKDSLGYGWLTWNRGVRRTFRVVHLGRTTATLDETTVGLTRYTKGMVVMLKDVVAL